jgi:hypothetical protein
LIPRTDSYFSFTSLPSDSPPGRDTNGNPATNGLTGAVAPSEFLYRQTTRLSRRFTLRAGGGVVRFGPGRLTNIPGVSKPLMSAASTPLALAGLTFAPNKRVSFDLDVTRLAITYTPLAAKLGVVEERMNTGFNVSFSPRTEFHLNYFFARYYTKQFKKLEGSVLSGSPFQNRASHTPFHGVSIIFNRNFLRSNHFSFDAGYTGMAFGHRGLTRQDVFLGFFNPVFYHRNMVSLRPYGKLSGPLSYEISCGLGIQQADLGKPIKRALIVGPSITVKASPRVSFTLGYLYYNTPQSLGTLTGNAVRFSSDWRF